MTTRRSERAAARDKAKGDESDRKDSEDFGDDDKRDSDSGANENAETRGRIGRKKVDNQDKRKGKQRRKDDEDDEEDDNPNLPPAAPSTPVRKTKGSSSSTQKRRRSINPNHFRSEKKTRRSFWSQEEVDALLKGVDIMGPGKWTKIKAEYPTIFYHRTSLDLKDKWRNIERRPETNKTAKVSRTKKRAASEGTEPPAPPPSLIRPLNEGLEMYMLKCTCANGDKVTTYDNCVSSTQTVEDLYKWAYSKLSGRDDEPSDDQLAQIEILTDKGELVPRSGMSLKKCSLISDGSSLKIQNIDDDRGSA